MHEQHEQTPNHEDAWGRVDDLFRVGPGYINYWLHEATEHWTISESELKAVRELGYNLGQLMKRRNEVEDARRKFVPASSLYKPNLAERTEFQRELFDATSGFFLMYYSALSALVGVAVRFRPELHDSMGEVPHRSNSKFLAWLKPHAMLPSHFDVLTDARQFRTVLDHKASAQPYEWGTVVRESEGLVRAVLHGPAGQSGNFPDGALPLLGDTPFPKDHDWAFYAPDEDLVLTCLAVQMNALFPRINSHRFRPESMRCAWVNRLGPHDPEDGYPIFAAMSGTVTSVEPHMPDLSPEDRATIDEILAKYSNCDLPDLGESEGRE
ncbi:hypothetical protein [Microbacterium sp. bgisy203]|uniref:hypothetical protein n=1 Tax=Microbacterium sp. bgisy203 TaxID=3413799 RepID=UPI003D74E836